jgi:serine protease AprX
MTYTVRPLRRAIADDHCVTGASPMTPARSTRRLRCLALGAGLASVLLPAAGASGATMAKGTTWTARHTSSRLGATTMSDVIVQARAGSEAAVAAAITAAGGVVDSELPVVNGFAAHVPAASVASLRAHAGVREVSENSTVRFAGNVYDDSTVASSYAKSAGAPAAWSAGNLGEGVGVAVIDTGVSPHNDFAGRLVHGPDLSGEGTYVDTYGHGTVMAGIVAGSGADSAGNAQGAYAGVAPKATLVSVKVAGRNGAADVSTMLQAMHWVAAYKSQFNIRVLNLSWGTDSTADPATDPINYAVERLWKQYGIVVVVAAGNSGPELGTITKPGDDPVVLTVGAYNDGGNTSTSDDAAPGWSSRGPTAQGLTKPDVVAPGRTLVSTRSLGSTVEKENPKARVSPTYIKGSGTSQSTAVVSGLAALILKAHPDWTPDQVKYALRSTASPIPGVGVNKQGKGRVSVADAIHADVSAAPVQPMHASGLGAIERSRGTAHVYADCQQDGTWTEVRGEMDVYCQPWNGASWTGASWTGASWTGASWTGASWTGASWTGGAWSGASWTGASWTGASWTGASWTGASWTGASWTGASWTGASWTGASWTGASWTSAEYDEGEDVFLTAFFGTRPKADKHVNGERSEPRQVENAAGD